MNNTITVQFLATSSYSASFPPAQRMVVGNSTNPQYLRYATLSPDALTFFWYTASCVIPMSSLWGTVVNYNPYLTYAPIIQTQPNATETITHPGTASYTVGASAETPITYAWYVQSGSPGPFIPATASNYQGTGTSATLTASCANNSTASFNFYCVVSNASGQVTSNTASLEVL